MTLNHLIVLIACVLLVCVHQSTAANLGCLNINLNKVCRKQENLRNEVEDIWAVIATSGIQKQDYGNKTRTDDLGTIAQELISKVDGTLTSIQGLKTEVKHLIVSSRSGFKNEKSWQREAIRNITKYCEDFKTDMTEKNIESKHHLERLDNRAAQLDQTCKSIQTRVENNTIETEKEQHLINEQTSHLLGNLNATQNRLETENRDLKQTVSDMQENNQQKLNNLETENRDLKQTVSDMQENNQQKLNNLETENRDLKQTVSDMQENNQQKLNNIETENRELRNIIVGVQKDYKKLQNAYEQINRELIKLQAATLTTKCDGHWKHLNGHCYLVVLQYKSWVDASAYCSSKNSYLLEITTDTEREFVSELVRDYGYPQFWTGATDRDTTGSFIYHHSRLPIPENYWREGEPDNLGGNQHCVAMYRYYGSGVVDLFDNSCTYSEWFVCEKSAA